MLEEERFLLEKIINLFIISLLVNSCTIVSTAGSLVGSASTSTRGFSGTIEDTYLMSKIVSKITLMKLSNFSNITVSVINGKVLLAGNIENQEKRLELIKKVWWIDGVKEVLNELEIGPRTSFSEKAEDFVFEAKIEKRLLFEPGIFSNNYSVDVVNGKVYVMGISSDIEEKTKVENFLNNMNDIKKLILLVDIPKILKMANKNLSAFFQMDPFEKLNTSSDSTVSIIREGLKKNIKIWVGLPGQITFKKSEVIAKGYEILDDGLRMGKVDELQINKLDFFFHSSRSSI